VGVKGTGDMGMEYWHGELTERVIQCVIHVRKAHYAQVRSYLKATRLPVAILINFSTERADFRRIESR
jgi:GxxExxY protein